MNQMNNRDFEPSRGVGEAVGQGQLQELANPEADGGRNSVDAGPAEQSTPVARWSPPKRSLLTRLAAFLFVILAILAILYAWQLPPFADRFEQTDDAYVRGQTTVISPQVAGYVADVTVKDFQSVEKNEVLVAIDDRIYAAKVAQAKANLLTQVSNLRNSIQGQHSAEASELAGDAGILNAEAQLQRAAADMRRIDDLYGRGWVTTRDRDQQIAAVRAAEAGLRQARAAREINRENVKSVIVARGGLQANVEAARAQVRLAEIDLGHTVIRAPGAGQLSEVGVRRGQFVSAGTQLMFLVPTSFWVTANYREAQTRRMHPGQRASFTVDALGGAVLHGRIESLAPATGSEFSVLRPDNATGNFVKVAQRIAVRIRIDADQPLMNRLRPGMSVVARVDTSDD